MKRDEAHYTIKGVENLPAKGNQNNLYFLKSDGLTNLYKALPNGSFETMAVGTPSGISISKTLVFTAVGGYAEPTSGPLVIGDTYVVDGQAVGDDFSNIGYVTDGVEFVATGTTPTTWTNGSYVFHEEGSIPTLVFLQNDFEGVTFTVDMDYNIGPTLIASEPIFDTDLWLRVGTVSNNGATPTSFRFNSGATLGINKIEQF